MKQTKLMKLLATVAVCAVATSVAVAQETAVTSSSTSTQSTTSMNTAGTISAFTPGSDVFTVKTESSTTPMKYYYSKTTTVVDPEGKTLSMDALKPDMPATFYYTKEGDRTVVSKIVVTKPAPAMYEKKESTTTTTTTP